VAGRKTTAPLFYSLGELKTRTLGLLSSRFSRIVENRAAMLAALPPSFQRTNARSGPPEGDTPDIELPRILAISHNAA
jgi:hypothetical protein